MLYFTLHRIRDGNIDPTAFSWKQVYELHTALVHGKLRQDMIALRKTLSTDDTIRSFQEALTNLEPLLDELVEKS